MSDAIRCSKTDCQSFDTAWADNCGDHSDKCLRYLHTEIAAKDAQITELKAENKKLKALCTGEEIAMLQKKLEGYEEMKAENEKLKAELTRITTLFCAEAGPGWEYKI